MAHLQSGDHCEYMQELSFFLPPFYLIHPREWCHPQWAGLPTSVNQENPTDISAAWVILDSVRLTVTNTTHRIAWCVPLLCTILSQSL